jgi:thymidylate synthase
MYVTNKTRHVRETLKTLLYHERFVTDKTGCKMIEIPGACFYADEPAIFGQPSQDYINREILWYESRSLNVNDIPAPIPAIWKAVATPDGRINSNYGWCIWSEENGRQFKSCLATLQRDLESRRAVMIYTRPSMQTEYNKDGMSDFMCTNTVQYLVRDERLHAVVQMRSNDVVFGYKNDYAWQKHVQLYLCDALKIPAGNIIWQVSSLHVYEKHFGLVK